MVPGHPSCSLAWGVVFCSHWLPQESFQPTHKAWCWVSWSPALPWQAASASWAHTWRLLLGGIHRDRTQVSTRALHTENTPKPCLLWATTAKVWITLKQIIISLCMVFEEKRCYKNISLLKTSLGSLSCFFSFFSFMKLHFQVKKVPCDFTRKRGKATMLPLSVRARHFVLSFSFHRRLCSLGPSQRGKSCSERRCYLPEVTHVGHQDGTNSDLFDFLCSVARYIDTDQLDFEWKVVTII